MAAESEAARALDQCVGSTESLQLANATGLVRVQSSDGRTGSIDINQASATAQPHRL